VRFRGVSKSFGTLEVIRGIDLDVPGGQKVAVIGPSGSGKTTLLRLIMTLERPEKGTIEIEGELLGLRREKGRLAPDSDRHLRQVRGKIGMVFQHFNLFPHMTALQNVMVGPVQVLRLPQGEASERALDLLKLVGLADKATAYPRQLAASSNGRDRARSPYGPGSCCSTSDVGPRSRADREVLDVVRNLAHQNP
jgi:polar amino acid transport system ATP-binding protein